MGGMTTAGLTAALTGEEWHYVGGAGEPAFDSSVDNVGSPYSGLAFRLREGGMVDIRGVIWRTAADTPIFTLPTGYWPNYQVAESVLGTFTGVPAALRMTVNDAGEVACGDGNQAGTVVYIDVTFPLSVPAPVAGASVTGSPTPPYLPYDAVLAAGVGTSYQPLDSDLTAIAALTTTATGRSLLAAANAAAIATITGVGTADSPQFTAVNVGHASDTTLARASAGDLTVEGNAIYRAGGTDVPVADGGTGASTAANARTNLGLVIGTNVQAWDADLDSIAALTGPATIISKAPRPLFDHYADAQSNNTPTETDLYTDTLAAGQLAANGDKLTICYSGTWTNTARTKRIRFYFGGTQIFDTTANAFTNSSMWAIDCNIIRVSSTTIRYDFAIQSNNTAGLVSVLVGMVQGEQAGYTLANTQVVKITGLGGAGAVTGDITAQSGSIIYTPAA